jgi:hypothetical protein
LTKNYKSSKKLAAFYFFTKSLKERKKASLGLLSVANKGEFKFVLLEKSGKKFKKNPPYFNTFLLTSKVVFDTIDT